MTVDPMLRALIGRRSTTDQLRNSARTNGMETLAEDAHAKVAAGLTAAAEAAPLLTLVD
jgi:type II secretory ATPase GspE/PulE/Tfp pilus assembly ATPase PilB-like protein